MTVLKPVSKYSLELSEKISHILFAVIIYSSTIYFFSFITADTDLWGHVRFGEELWKSKTLLHFDIYSFTSQGQEWMNHEWLSEVLMYLVYTAFGSPGLLIGKMLIGLTVITVLFQICRSRYNHPLIYGIVFVMSVFIMSPGFMIRPQLSTFLFTSFFLFVFHLYLERGVNLLWTLPLIMIFWVNSHGGFLIGFGMFPIVVICEIILCFMKKTDRKHLPRLIFWLMLTEISVLINPYGYNLLFFLFESLNEARSISEWNAVNIFDLSYIRFKMLTILVILAMFIDKSRNRYWEVSIIIVTIFYAFYHQRHTPIFAIAATPFLIEKLSILGEKVRLYKRLKSLSSYSILNVVLIVIISYQVSHAANKHIKTGLNIIVDPRIYPVYAVNFLKENRIKGNIILPFDWGEYAIWHLYPDCKVSIDGRFRTAYPESVLNDHFEASLSYKNMIKLRDSYPGDIFLARRSPYTQAMIDGTREDWVYVYSDNLSIIFLKNAESQTSVLEKLKEKKLVYPGNELSVYFP